MDGMIMAQCLYYVVLNVGVYYSMPYNSPSNVISRLCLIISCCPHLDIRGELASLNIDRVENALVVKGRERLTHFRPSNLKLLQNLRHSQVKDTNIAISNLH